MNLIEIWQPRYKDRTCLIARYKVGNENLIRFTKAKHLKGMSFVVAGSVIQKHPLEDNGKVPCYAVPMDLILDKRREDLE